MAEPNELRDHRPAKPARHTRDDDKSALAHDAWILWFRAQANQCKFRRVNTITLITDFGTRDWFVGTMKSVILGINAHAAIVDITHEIPPGDIRAGAFALAASYRFAPKGTVHVAVVDPGVGSARKPIAVRTAEYFFVGPDNGVLSWALQREKIRTIRVIKNERFCLQPRSRTFHGRDIFAPVAAHLSIGVPIQMLGPAATKTGIIRLPWPEPAKDKKVIRGEIVYIDKFGNAITNIAESDTAPEGTAGAEVVIGRKLKCAVAEFYGAVQLGEPVAVFGSSGLLEVAVNGGNAAAQFRLHVGQEVTLRLLR